MNKIDLNGAKKVHFIGIGGISMSGLAEVLKRDGYTVTGSDGVKTGITDHLQAMGIPVFFPNAAENVADDIDMVVYTAAIKKDNPEFIAAGRNGKPLIERAALLGLILKGYDHAICVAGSHGKTSTTSLLAEITVKASLDPTISIGGHMRMDGTNYRVGNSSYFLLEACEYSNSYHHWHPHLGIILNIDADHLDFFGDEKGVIASFKRFAQNIHPSGTLVIRKDTLGFDEVIRDLQCNVVTFGAEGARFWANNITHNELGHSTFDVMDGTFFLTKVNLPLPGEYNMLNALAAFAAATMLGIEPSVIADALSTVKGVKRRYEYKGMYNGTVIIDDYAHHPTEIRECLAAAKKGVTGKLYCIFQPHTYTRTRNHLQDFAQAFEDADHIMLLPIYAAREKFDPTISSLDLEKGIKNFGGDVVHLNDFETAKKYLQQKLCPGDMLITMGAGDVHFVGELLLST